VAVSLRLCVLGQIHVCGLPRLPSVADFFCGFYAAATWTRHKTNVILRTESKSCVRYLSLSLSRL